MRPKERIKPIMALFKNEWLNGISDKVLSIDRMTLIDLEFPLKLNYIDKAIRNVQELFRAITKYWKENPDLRFGQLLIVLGFPIDKTFHWHKECIEFIPKELHNKVFLWKTYGKTGKERAKSVLISKMDSEHIKAVLKTQKQLSDKYRDAFMSELKERELKFNA